jgi:hypothetical protein
MVYTSIPAAYANNTITLFGNTTTVTPQQCMNLSHLLQSYERQPQNFSQSIVVNATAHIYQLACGPNGNVTVK